MEDDATGDADEKRTFALNYIREEAGEDGVLRMSSYKLSQALADAYEERYGERERFGQTVRELAEEHAARGTVAYGADDDADPVTPKKLEYTLWTVDGDPASAEESYLTEHAEDLEREYSRVNSAIRTLQRVKDHLSDSDLPNYEQNFDQGHIRDFVSYYGKQMAEVAEQVTGLSIDFDPKEVRVEIGDRTGFRGKEDGTYRITVREEDQQGDPFEQSDDLREAFRSAPTAPETSTDDTEELQRVPDVLAVDLIHELGHVISAKLTEATMQEQGSPVPDEYERDPAGRELGVNPEESANQLAVLTVERLARNAGGALSGAEDLERGLSAYIEMTKFDTQGVYRQQHPLEASEDTIEDAYTREEEEEEADRI